MSSVQNFGIAEDIANKHIQSVNKHREAVMVAGLKIGVPKHQLEIHDLSKLDEEEFVGYAMHFHGGGAQELFDLAWLHHIHNNPHHWNHWVFPGGTKALPMPYHYVLEMVADWMGASHTYSKKRSYDITDWLFRSMSTIILHPDTAEMLRELLDHLGYADIVNGQNFHGGL